MEKLIENITNVLKTVKYPGFSRDIVSFGIISKISTDPQNNIIIDITLSTTNQENKNIIEKSIHEKITSNFNFNQVIINPTVFIKKEIFGKKMVENGLLKMVLSKILPN